MTKTEMMIEAYCKRNNIPFEVQQMQYCIRFAINYINHYELEKLIRKFNQMRRVIVKLGNVYNHTMFVYDAGEYDSAQEKEREKQAYLDDWWMRYHLADAETKRLMACGAIE